MVNEETKIQDNENEPIISLLRDLRRVEAPSDFDFRVRARIASGRPAERTGSWLPASVRYAVPLALLLFVGVYFGLNQIYSPGNIQTPTVAGGEVETIAPAPGMISPNIGIDIPANEIVAEHNDVKPSDAVTKTVVKQTEKTVSTRNTKADRPGGGSFEIGQGIANTLTNSLNVSNANAVNAPKPPVAKAPISVEEFLTSVGVVASIAGSSGKVHAVSGAAASAGIKPGDVIESVNVQTGSIRVRRDGKVILVTIRPFKL